MQNIPSFMPPEPTHLQIEVKSNNDGTFETNLYCALNGCGKSVTIESDGPKAIQIISCAEHGVLTSLPHQIALREFVRFLANEILARNGHELIEAGAVSIFGDQLTRESIN
jgi:hypothetical protein